MRAGDEKQRRADTPWLASPWPRSSGWSRWLVVSGFAFLVLAWCVLRSGYLVFDPTLPDVPFYLDMAYGRYGVVPQPFSSRPLAPLLARFLASAGHISIEAGFTALTYVSLVCALVIVFWLLIRSTAPGWALVAVAAVTFWPELRSYSGVPDPLYTALLATLLLALERGWLLPSAALMFPLMLARESTWLTLLCFLLVAWRGLGWSGRTLAIGSAVAGALMVRHFTGAGLPNQEHLTVGMYMGGKFVSNFFRSFGLHPWSNVYPFLCSVPMWQMRVPLGRVTSVGVCSWSYVAPLQVTWALLTTFGVLPLLLVALWRKWKDGLIHGDAVLRFSLLYGGISLLLAPVLGTWYARLFGYGWPLLLVAVPRLLGRVADGKTWSAKPAFEPAFWGCLLLVHLVICAVGTEMGTPEALAVIVGLQLVACALIMVQMRIDARLTETP